MIGASSGSRASCFTGENDRHFQANRFWTPVVNCVVIPAAHRRSHEVASLIAPPRELP
jgi:hypothetical protein